MLVVYVAVGIAAWPVFALMLVNYSRREWPRLAVAYDECAGLALIFALIWPASVGIYGVARTIRWWDMR